MASKKKDKRKLTCITFTHEGRRYYCYGKTKADAAARIEQKKKELREGAFKAGHDLTLEEYFKRWETSREGTVTPATIGVNRSQFKAISDFVVDKHGHKLGQIKLKDIDKNTIINLQKKLSDDLSTHTTNLKIKLLKRILRTAVEERIIDWNPAEGIKMLKRTEPQARETYHRALTKEETAAFLEAAKDSWYYPLYLLLLNTGMRIGEAGALKLSDIKADHIKIRRSLTTSECYNVIMGEDVKTEAGRRTIPLTPAIKEAIDLQKANNAIVNGNIIDLDMPIFISPDGVYLRDRSVNKNISGICKKIGIDHISAHCFRDTFATRAIESGMDLKTLQEILGHSNFNITMTTYAHVMEDTKSEQLQLVKVI